MDDVLRTNGMTELRREQPLKLRSGTLLRDEELFVRKIRPTNPRIMAQRMMHRKSYDHPLTPKRKHPAFPCRRVTRHDRDIDCVARESTKQPIMATIDGAYIHIRKAPVVLDQRRVHVPRRRGGMNADR